MFQVLSKASFLVTLALLCLSAGTDAAYKKTESKVMELAERSAQAAAIRVFDKYRQAGEYERVGGIKLTPIGRGNDADDEMSAMKNPSGAKDGITVGKDGREWKEGKFSPEDPFGDEMLALSNDGKESFRLVINLKDEGNGKIVNKMAKTEEEETEEEEAKDEGGSDYRMYYEYAYVEE